MKNFIPILAILFFVHFTFAQSNSFKDSSKIVGLVPDQVNPNTEHETDLSDQLRESNCYETVETLYVADYEEASIVENNEHITYVASNSIIFSDGFHAKSGSEIHAFIVSNYCPNQEESILANPSNNINLIGNNFSEDSNEQESILNESEILIYPNPTNGKIYIDFLSQSLSHTEFILMDLKGQIIQNSISGNQEKKELDLTNLPEGSYMIVIKNSDQIIKERLLKSKILKVGIFN